MNPSARGAAHADVKPPESPTSGPLTVMAGGLGAVGRMLHRELADQLIHVVDIDPRQGSDTADITCPGSLQQEQLQRAATVVLAVPETVAVDALPTLTQLLRPDALLVETLSVKSRFADALTRLQPPFEVIGINPMFGPSLHMDGRAVAVVPYKASKKARSFTSLLEESGAQVTELSATAHDRATVALQAMPHLLILAYAHAFQGLGVDIDDIVRLAPPPACALLSLAARIAAGNAHVYSEIQAANPFAISGRSGVADALAQLSEACQDPVRFQAMLEDVGIGLGESRESLLAAAERMVSQPLLTEPSGSR